MLAYTLQLHGLLDTLPAPCVVMAVVHLVDDGETYKKTVSEKMQSVRVGNM